MKKLNEYTKLPQFYLGKYVDKMSAYILAHKHVFANCMRQGERKKYVCHHLSVAWCITSNRLIMYTHNDKYTKLFTEGHIVQQGYYYFLR